MEKYYRNNEDVLKGINNVQFILYNIYYVQ